MNSPQNLVKITDSTLTLSQFVDAVTTKANDAAKKGEVVTLEVSNVTIQVDKKDEGWSLTTILVGVAILIVFIFAAWWWSAKKTC